MKTLRSLACVAICLCFPSPAPSQSVEFFGSHYLMRPDDPLLDLTAEFTVEAWALAYPYDIDGNPVVAKGNETETYGLWQAVGDARGYPYQGPFAQINWHLPANWQDPGQARIVFVLDDSALLLQEWHHLAMVKASDGLRLFVDGQLADYSPSTFDAIPTDEPLYIGVDFPGGHEYFFGCIDEVRIWGGALSAQEVYEHFADPRSTSASVPLVARWSFDEGQGQTAFDQSGNGLHLQLGNSPDPDANDPVWGAHEPPALDNDADDDGVPDEEDICPGGDDNADGDLDGVPDFCDPCPSDPENDADGDGVCGDVDVCPGGDDFHNTDGDSLPDFCDICPLDAENDADGDGICESNDNCPVVWNPSQADADSDGQGDECDPDDDNDGVPDAEDNCVLLPNAGQEDFDGDGAGDICDTDKDNDGVLDADDGCPETPVGDTVAADGCSIAQLCPCVHLQAADRWKNHGAYVSCVAHTSSAFLELGLITQEEKDETMANAAASTCGHKK